MPRPNFQFSVLSSQFAIFLAFATTAFSQATFPSPVLTSISPLAARHSSTVEMTLRGTDLDAPMAVLLNSENAIKSHYIQVQRVAGKTNVIRFKLPEDTLSTYYNIRFVGCYGVSNPRGFLIHLEDEVVSPGTNMKRDTAHKINLNSVIQGSFKSAAPQWFSFDAYRGQHVLIGFAARYLDVRTELLGAILDSEGHEVGRLNGGDLNLVVPESGTYFLRLQELMYRSGDDYGFCVETVGMPAFQVEQQVSENEHQLIKLTSSIRGYFSNKPRIFDLPFKTGDKFIIEVRSHQFGHASDPNLIIENLKADGTLTPQAEIIDAPPITPTPSINIANRDPSYAYQAKADGTFRISIYDSFNTSSPFELRVYPASAPFPDPDLVALNLIMPGAKTKGAEMGSANVPRNGIAALEIIVPNRTALSEPIELKAGNLPDGVTCLGGFIGKGQSLGYIAFQASADAPSGASILSGIPQSRFVSFAVADATKDNALYRTTSAPALGVSAQLAPAFVQTEKNDIFEVATDGKLEIDLKVTRHADFSEALKLKVLGLIDPTKAPEADISAKATTGKLKLDLKALKLPPGDYGFILQGPAKMKVQRPSEALMAAEAKLKDADEAAKKAVREREFGLAARKNPKDGDDFEANEKALKQTLADAGQAEVQKREANELIKNLTAKLPAKDATFIVYSNPIRIRVKEVAKK